MSEHYFEFKNVCKAFDDNAVLKDVSFFVEQGETAVIMGRSGVGKSVSLKLLLGFLAPDSGRIIVAGQDVTDWTEEQFSRIRRRVTMVFQSGALFDSLTVEENIAFPLESRSEVEAPEKIDATVKELMAELEVADFADSLPSDLSTGAKRAVAIARALAEDPDAILYDEPTTMVDPLMAAHISDLITKLKAQAQEDFDRGDARHPPGEEAGRPDFVSAGRARGIFRHLAGTGRFQGAVFTKFSCAG